MSGSSEPAPASSEREPREPEQRGILRSVVFADVADSSRLYSLLGDEEAYRYVCASLAIVRKVVEARAGRVVDCIGDELFCVFPDAPAGLWAALEAQDGIRRAALGGELPRELRLRIGVHAGEVTEEGGRVFGNSVYVANRVATLAKADQILTTRSTLASLDDGTFQARFVDRVVLKGQEREHEIVEILFGSRATIETGRRSSAALAHSTTLELQAHGQTWRLDRERPRLSLGRDAVCDVVVDAVAASRRHATIERSSEGWAFRDFSTNGTLVRPSALPDQVVRRQTVLLRGFGTLFLGADETDAGSALSYAVHDEEAAP